MNLLPPTALDRNEEIDKHRGRKVREAMLAADGRHDPRAPCQVTCLQALACVSDVLWQAADGAGIAWVKYIGTQERYDRIKVESVNDY